MPKDVKPLTPDEQRFYIESLEADGFTVAKEPPRTRAAIKLKTPKPGGKVRLAIVSDTHLGNRAQQLTHLHDFYRTADEWGAEAFLHGGDFVDGLHVHRDAVYHQFAHGFDAQLKYAAREYPVSKNGPTYAIEGNHDLWYFGNAGASPIEWLAEKRKDILYLGHDAAFIEVGGLRMLLQHGRKGGAYAKSYKLQKILEQMRVEERSGTHLAFFGHWHTDLYLGRYQGVFTWGLPCFQAQTSYERSEVNKHPVVGGLLLEVEFTRDMKVWDITPRFRYYEPLVDDYPGLK